MAARETTEATPPPAKPPNELISATPTPLKSAVVKPD